MFHSYKDGKGIRHVFVNGNRIYRVMWANEEQGLVCFNPHVSLTKKSKRKGEIHTRLLRGEVKVVFVHETPKIADQTSSRNT